MCGVWSNNQLDGGRFFCESLPPHSFQNGLTAMDVAAAKRDSKTWYYHSIVYKEVCHLLQRYTQKSAPPATHHVRMTL